jgi:hypothetical protein
LNTVGYDKNGKNNYNWSGQDASYGYGRWEAAIPGTVIDVLIDAACTEAGYQ